MGAAVAAEAAGAMARGWPAVWHGWPAACCRPGFV